MPLGNVVVPPVGAPDTDSVTVFGMFPVGVTVTVKLAGMPAATVAVLGETLTPKLLTTATAGAAGVNTCGRTENTDFPAITHGTGLERESRQGRSQHDGYGSNLSTV